MARSSEVTAPKKATIKERQLDLKYRPWQWSDVVGHAPVLNELKAIVKNASKSLPAVLGFFGESGRGKTTLARMMATYLNCATDDACGECESCTLMLDNRHPDYKEINMAEIGADEVGAIINNANFKPRFKTRIIFLDEIHKIKSQQAMDKLLKPMEEPPVNTMWVIATNLPEKIPNNKAVVGRTLAFWLNAPTPEEISKRLQTIAKLEKMAWVTSEMTNTLAQNCNAQVRNSVKSLERLINAGTEFFSNDRKAKRTGKIDKKSLDVMLSSITSAGVGEDSEVNQLASDLLLALYTSDPGKAMVAIMSCKDQVKLVNSMMYLNQYVLAVQFTQRCPGIWHSDTNKAFAALVKKVCKAIPANELGMLHKAIIDLRMAVVSGNVDATQHMIAGCMNLMLPPE
ncbi:clamp loader of DNA polymerase [Pseudomonas phage vB_PpuM-Lauda]